MVITHFNTRSVFGISDNFTCELPCYCTDAASLTETILSSGLCPGQVTSQGSLVSTGAHPRLSILSLTKTHSAPVAWVTGTKSVTLESLTAKKREERQGKDQEESPEDKQHWSLVITDGCQQLLADQLLGFLQSRDLKPAWRVCFFPLLSPTGRFQDKCLPCGRTPEGQSCGSRIKKGATRSPGQT